MTIYEDIIGKTPWLKVDKDGNITDNSKMLKSITAKDVNNLLEKCKLNRANIKTLTSNCRTIGEAAFKGCTGIDKIELNNCTEIRKEAFINCSCLANVHIPNCKKFGKEAFKGCVSVSSLIWKQSGTNNQIVSIFPDSPAIQGDISDATIVKKSWWLKIDKSGCLTDNSKFLKTITKKDVEQAQASGEDAKKSVIKVVSACQKIAPNAFNSFVNLKEIHLKNCTEIGDGAFAHCHNLWDIFAPKLKKVADSAFNGCHVNTKIKVPKGVVDKIPRAGTFTDTPENIKKVETDGGDNFYNDSELIVLKNDKIKCVGSGKFERCEKLEEINLSKATKIGPRVFAGCIKLKSLKLPECQSIGYQAFMNCPKLVSIELPKCVEIGANAFFGTSVKTLSIPKCKHMEIGALGGAFTELEELDISSLPSSNLENMLFQQSFRFNNYITIIISRSIKGKELEETESYLKGYFPNLTIKQA